MPRIPQDLGLPRADPGVDPVRSPTRSIIGTTASTVATVDQFLEEEQLQADRMSELSALSDLDRDVSDYVSEVMTDKSARGLAAGLEARFKDRPQGVQDRVSFSRRNKINADRKARAALNLTRARLRQEDFRRNRLDEMTTTTTALDSASKLAAQNQIPRSLFAEQVDSILDQTQSRHLDRNDVTALRRVALAQYEDQVLQLEDQAGLYVTMERHLTDPDPEERFDALSAADTAKWRARALAGMQRVTAAETLQRIPKDPIAAEALHGRTGGILRPEDRISYQTAIEAEQAMLAADELGEMLNFDEAAVDSESVRAREVTWKLFHDGKIGMRQLVRSMATINAKGSAARKRIHAEMLKEQEQAYTLFQRGQAAMAQRWMTRIARFGLTVAEGQPDYGLLDGITETGIVALYRQSHINDRQQEELFRALTALQRSGTLSDEEIEDRRRLEQILAGQNPDPTRSRDRKIMEEMWRTFLDGTLGPEAFKDADQIHLASREFWGQWGWIPRDAAQTIGGDIASPDPSRKARGTTEFAYYYNRDGGPELLGMLKAQGIPQENLDFLTKSAYQLTLDPTDTGAAMERAQFNAGLISTPEVKQATVAQTNFRLGLTDPDTDNPDSIRLPNGDLVPADKEGRDAQGYLRLINGVGNQFEYKDPDLIANREWVLRNLITEADFVAHRDLDTNTQVGLMRTEMRAFMRTEIRRGLDPQTAAFNTWKAFIGSKAYGLDDVFSGAEPRWVKGPPSRDVGPVETQDAGNLTRREWATESLRHTIRPAITQMMKQPQMTEQLLRIGALVRDETGEFVLARDMEPSDAKQFADFVDGMGSDTLASRIVAYVGTQLDLGDPNTQENLAYMLTLGVDFAEGAAELPSKVMLYIATQALASNDRNQIESTPELREYVKQGGNVTDVNLFRTRAAIRSWRDALASSTRPPIRFEPLPTQPGVPTQYIIRFQNQAAEGLMFDRVLMDVRRDPRTGEWFEAGPVAFQLDPNDSPSARRLIAKQERISQMQRAQARGVFDALDEDVLAITQTDELVARLARDPSLVVPLQTDPSFRKHFARRLATSESRIRFSKDDPKGTLAEQKWLREIDQLFQTNTEPLGPPEETTFELLQSGATRVRDFIQEPGETLPRELQ